MVRLINKKCFDLNPKDPYFASKEDISMESAVVVAKFKNENFKDSLVVLYSAGASDDPSFSIMKSANQKVEEFYCTELYLNTNGVLYTAGHTNNMFNHRHKFLFQKDKIVEVSQPYYYVGLKGKTTKAITLYQEKTGNETVAQLPIAYEIEVLLAEKKNDLERLFLVRTDFGLVGWLRLSEKDLYDRVIEGLYFAGD
jgi:hypothetical protein